MSDSPNRFNGPHVAIGRAPSGADTLVIDRASVAGRQADARRLEDGTWLLEDHGVGSGTWIEGRPISTARLNVGDSFVVGGEPFRVDERGIQALAPGRGLGVVFQDVVARYPRSEATALSGVSFTHNSGMLAIVGPSGAGKSTSLKALLGDLEIVSGRLSVGLAQLTDLASTEFMRAHAAYVPQSDDLHRMLRVGELLDASARLRQASDVTRSERHAKTAEIGELLGLGRLFDRPINKLSGGQRKRVSVAMELLGDPALLLLDEPTSGLDPGKDRQLMELFSKLARRGCTVIVVTHSTENLDLADATLVVRRGGSPVYCGPAARTLSTLGESSWPNLMCRLDDNPESFSTVPAGQPVVAGVSSPAAPSHPPQRASLMPLVGREVRVVLRRGTGSLAAMLVTPLAGAGLAALASDRGLAAGEPGSNPELSMALAILVTVCALGGTALTYNDIVTQQATLRRDWRVGVEAGQLIAAKTLVFGVLATALGLLTTGAFLALRPGPDVGALGLPSIALVGLVLCLVYGASMALGMTISAWTKSLEQAVSASTGLAVAQVSLSGILFAVPAAVNLATVGIPSRWGTAALAAAIDLNGTRSGMAHTDALWESGDRFVAAWVAILVLQLVAYLAVARVGLKRAL